MNIKIILKAILSGVGVLLICVQCTPEKPVAEPQIDYFPLRVGQTARYLATHTYFVYDSGNLDTLKKQYFLRQTALDYYQDLEGKSWLRVQIDSTNSLNDTTYYPIRQLLYRKEGYYLLEKNPDYITVLLHTIPRKGLKWNYNIWNSFGLQTALVVQTNAHKDTIITLKQDTSTKKYKFAYQNAVITRRDYIEPSLYFDEILTHIFEPNTGKIYQYERKLRYEFNGNRSVLKENSYIYEQILLESN